MSKADKENPFLASKKEKKKQAPEPPTVPDQAPVTAPADIEAYLLGQPVTSFRADEREFIDEQMNEFLKVMEKNPGSKIFVNEIVLTALEMQRHDANVTRQRAAWGTSRLSEENTQWLLRMDKVRDGLLKRHMSALEAIGALPKDALMRAGPDECMADMYKRYIEEVKARKASGQGLGRPSDAALELAESVGLNTSGYRSDVLPDAARDEVLAELDAEEAGEH